MRTLLRYCLLAGLFFLLDPVSAQNHVWFPRVAPEGKNIVNTRIDNLSYWRHLIAEGLVEANPYLVTEPAVPTGSIIRGDNFFAQDSPDVPVTADPNTTQSENSVFADPLTGDVSLNSNNSTDWTGATANQLFGADYFSTQDAGETWTGSKNGAGQGNSGDPTTAIGRNGRWFVGKIANSWGQNVAWSDDQGQTWIDVISGPGPGGYNILDKNHLWIDNAESSPFEGHLYNAWTSFISGDPSEGQIQIVRSTDNGLSWSAPVIVSAAANAGSHNQGVNIQTGPDGEVYVFWTIYDGWPADETAIGLARSVDGGATWLPAVRIIGNLKGIRTTGTTKNMRVNSFPVATVDISNGPNSGNIYVVWANIGVPGINSGNDVDVYLIRSDDQGSSWSSPIRVNQDPSGAGKQHFLPWITCDPVTGNLCVVYYDDRNTGTTQCETWVSYSYDAGDSWTDLKVSDVAFTPGPIPGLAAGYFGDYLGIASNNMKVYPAWTDNRSGRALTYVSPLDLGPPPNQPFVTYYSNDLQPIPGKKSGNMNYGDSLYLSLGLKNIGDQPAVDLTATLSAASPYIIITDQTEPYGTMAPDEIKTIPQGYAFKVSDSVPDGLKIQFDVHVSDADTTWISHFKLEAHAPNLAVTEFIILDTAHGNGNGILDPGDTADILVHVANTGDFACQNTLGTLTSLSETVILVNPVHDLGTIDPLQEKTAVFTVMVDPEAPLGSGVSMLFEAVSGFYSAVYNYQETMGVLVEDWETHTFTKFPWEFGGDKNWVLKDVDPFEGTWCAESGWIYDQQSSQLFITYTTAVNDSITFYRRVSSETDWDFLYFYIDGVQVGAWSGELSWERVAFPVAAGTHTYKWSYEKDIFLSAGEDRARIDYIGFPPPIMPVVNSGSDDTICSGSVYQLYGNISNADSVEWITHGDGTFDTTNIPDPVYTPGPGDIQNGTVKLSLYGYGMYGLNYNSMILTIGDIPEVEATSEPSDTLCHGQTATLAIDTLESGTYLWMPGGFTTPEISVDTAVTGGLGSTLFTVSATNQWGCTGTDTLTITFKDCTAIGESGDGFRYSLSPNPCDGRFTLSIRTLLKETLNLRLTSGTGVIVWSEAGISLNRELNRSFDFTSLPAGWYLLEMERASGTVTEKVLITR